MNDNYEDKKSSSIPIEIPDNVHIAITAVTGIAAAITGPFYPLTSAIIASSLAVFPVLFKPENKVDIFDTIYHRINSLIDNKIDQVIYDNSKQHLKGISRLFEDFSLKLKEWEKDKTKGTEGIRLNIYYLDNELTSLIPMFQHPKQQGALLPLFANAAYRHITLLYTAITYYDELKFDNKIKLNSRASKDYFTTKIIKLIKEYSDYSGVVYKKEFKRIISNREKSWIDLNEYRNICTSSVHSYIMMLDFFNPETYPLAMLVDRRGYYRVIQNVVKDKDLDFPILSKTRNFDETFSNHYAVGKLEKIELGSLENLPYDPYTVSGLVYSYCYLYQFNDMKKFIGNKLNNSLIVSQEADIINENITGVRGVYPLSKQNNALIKPASCLKELFFNLDNKPISDNSQMKFFFIKKDVDNKVKYKNFDFGDYSNISDYLDIKDELGYLKDRPELLFMQTLTRGEVDITKMYNTINIFGWRFNYNNDLLPSGKATDFNEMKTQIYYAITSSKINKNSVESNIDKNSIISNLAFSQGSIICLRKGESIIFKLSKSNQDSNRWLLPGIYKIRLWHIKVKNSKVDITIEQYRKYSILDSISIINMELNNHDVRDEVEDEYIYSDLYFKQTDPFKNLTIKNDIHNIYISIKNTSTNKVIVDRLELIPI